VLVLGAHFDSTFCNKNYNETKCLISVAKNYSNTIGRPIVGSDVMWNEHFSIEYAQGDEASLVIFQVINNDTVLGQCEMKLQEIKPPKPSKERDYNESDGTSTPAVQSWQDTETKDFTLLNKKGSSVGTISLRLRREFKLYGTLVLEIKEAELQQSEIDAQIKVVKCIVKLATQVFTTPLANTVVVLPGNIIRFRWNFDPIQIKVDQSNHIFDVFIELWQEDPNTVSTKAMETTTVFSKDDKKDEKVNEKKPICGSVIGQARLTIDDAKSNFNSQIVLMRQEDHKKIGFLSVQARLKEDSA